MKSMQWNQHQEAADATTEWAQRNLDTQPSNSAFWDSEDGQETTAIVRELQLQPATTDIQRNDIAYVARRAGVEPSAAWSALLASDWLCQDAIDLFALPA